MLLGERAEPGSKGNIIKYIIDSAKFKQGKYAPASHLPIVSPESALKDSVDIIVIVAPGYSSEIENIIKRDFKPEMEIYTLKDDNLRKIN